MGIRIYQNVLNYTKSYLNIIRFLFLVSNLTFLDFGSFCDSICFNVCLKNGFFESCFQQSAKGIMFLSKSFVYDGICNQNFDL